MTVITNPNIKMVNNSVGRCPECKKFFGTKKLSADVIAQVNKHGVCPSCLDRLNLSDEEEETKMENTEMQAAEAVVVYPAAGIPSQKPYTSKLVIINRSETSMDEEADLVINDSIGAVLPKALELL